MGTDALRYFLLREITFGQDGSFSYDAIVQRYNSDLANGLGNLASRTLSMIQQYRGGRNAQVRRSPRYRATAAAHVRTGARGFDEFDFSRYLESRLELHLRHRQVHRRAGALEAGERPRNAQHAPGRDACTPRPKRCASSAALLYPVIPETTAQDLGATRHAGAHRSCGIARSALGTSGCRARRSARSTPVFPRIDAKPAIAQDAGTGGGGKSAAGSS